MYIHTCIRIYVYVYIYMSVYIHIYVCVHVHIYIYMYMYIYIYMHMCALRADGLCDQCRVSLLPHFILQTQSFKWSAMCADHSTYASQSVGTSHFAHCDVPTDCDAYVEWVMSRAMCWRTVWCVKWGSKDVAIAMATYLLSYSCVMHVLIHTNTLIYAATHCNTVQRTATLCNTLQHCASHCNTVQRTATLFNALQHCATYCNTVQHCATHCKIVFFQFKSVY